MPSSAYPNSTQYEFLKKLREHAHGVPVSAWPNPATLKRWMRRRTFRRAFSRLMATFRQEADYVAASAATRAAHGLHRLLGEIDSESDASENLSKYDKLIQQYLRILRMDQQRQRDRRVGELARTRTPAYLDYFQRRKEARNRSDYNRQHKARIAEILIEDLKKYRDLVDRPFTPDKCMASDVIESINQWRDKERRELGERLRQEGLLPPEESPAVT